MWLQSLPLEASNDQAISLSEERSSVERRDFVAESCERLDLGSRALYLVG